MTMQELNFSLLVEQMLSKIIDPAYRQIIVEAFMVVSTILRRNPELMFHQSVNMDKVSNPELMFHQSVNMDKVSNPKLMFHQSVNMDKVSNPELMLNPSTTQQPV